MREVERKAGTAQREAAKGGKLWQQGRSREQSRE